MSLPIPGGGYLPNVGTDIVLRAIELDAQSPKKARTRDELNPPPGVDGWDSLIDGGYIKPVDGRPGFFYLQSPFGGAARGLYNMSLGDLAPLWNWRTALMLLVFAAFMVYVFVS